MGSQATVSNDGFFPTLGFSIAALVVDRIFALRPPAWEGMNSQAFIFIDRGFNLLGFFLTAFRPF